MNKVAVVFGGTRGIGRGVAAVLLQDHYNVAVLSRKMDHVNEACEDIKQNLAQEEADAIQGLMCDITQEDDVNRCVKNILTRWGRVDVLINAAGINTNSLLVRTSSNGIHQQLNTNLIGPLLTCRAVLPGMLRQKHGTIINIGSVVGSKGNIGQCVYSASKAGLEGFTKSLAKEVASRGITANVIAPGFITGGMTDDLVATGRLDDVTSRIPLQRLGTPQDVASVVRMLVTCHYVTGAVIPVDGGLSLNL